MLLWPTSKKYNYIGIKPIQFNDHRPNNIKVIDL